MTSTYNPDTSALITPDKIDREALLKRFWRISPAPERYNPSSARKLSSADVMEIRGLVGIVTQKEMAQRYGLSQSAINKIVLGKHYRDVKEAA
jgi:hypothetical protein